LADDTPQAEKLARLHQLQAVINANVLRLSERLVGSTQRILVEGHSRKDQSELMGRTDCNRVVNFKGAARLIGQMIDVRITQAMTYTLRGEVVTSEAAELPETV
jgi:tRNA-2-methylthio-N6-dimethylallyladenosine synthase